MNPMRRQPMSRLVRAGVATLGLVFLASWLAVPIAAQAQIAPGVQQSAGKTATITGAAVDHDGKPVAGADVQLLGPAILRTRSDAHGTFIFTSVPFGTYSVLASAAGLGQAQRQNVAINGDTDVTIQFASSAATSTLKTIASVHTQSSGVRINTTPASITASPS